MNEWVVQWVDGPIIYALCGTRELRLPMSAVVEVDRGDVAPGVVLLAEQINGRLTLRVQRWTADEIARARAALDAPSDLDVFFADG